MLEKVADVLNDALPVESYTGASDGRESRETAANAGGGDDAGDGSRMPQEQRVRVVRNLIESEKMSDTSKAAKTNDVIDAAVDHGMDRAAAEATVEKLMREGRVYEPQSGYLRTTSSGGEA